MNLVFITRKVDRGDPLAGFVFGWIDALSKSLEKLYVICQEKGDVSGLPANVEVHSFGKEKGHGRLKQAYRLFIIAYQLARRADGFFVHMHPIYAIVAAIPAKLFRKKIALWYTHKAIDWKLRVAHLLVDEVFTASRDSFRLPSKKVKVVGHGIDLEKFKPNNAPQPPLNVRGGEGELKFRIVSIGRISPVKDYESLIKAALILKEKGIKDFVVEIYGRIGLPEHQGYYDSLVEFVQNGELEDLVKFQGELDYGYVDETYNEADLFVNLSQTGSTDKAILEAAACETLVLTSNEAFEKPLRAISELLIFRHDHPEELADKILKVKSLPETERSEIGRQLRAMVEKEHNLKNLAERIMTEFK